MTKKNIGERIYLFAFAIYIFVYFFTKTMFAEYIIYDLFTKVIKTIIVGLIFYKFLLCDKYKISHYFIIVFVSLCILLATYKSHNMDLFNFYIMLIGSYNVSFKKINQVFVIIILPLLIFTIISSQIGAIEDLVYEGYRNNIYTYRHSFGIQYPTDFAATCFFLLLSLAYILPKNKFFIISIVYLIIAYLLLYLCNARLDAISVVLLVFVLMLYKIRKFILKSIILKFVLITFPLFCALFSILSAYYFSWSIQFWTLINKALSGRLYLGQKAITDYGFSLFGTELEMNGLGGSTNKIFTDFYQYFYVDSSFLRIVLNYGIVIFVLLIASLTYFNYTNIKNKNLFVVMLLCLLCLNGVIAHHIIDLTYTPFLLCFSSIITSEKNETH